MFSWLAPMLPVSSEHRIWLDKQIVWIAEEIGHARIMEQPVILPTAEFFPDPYHQTIDDAKIIFDRLCQYLEMPIDKSQLWVVEFGSDLSDKRFFTPGRAAPLTSLPFDVPKWSRILVLHRHLEYPMKLVATMVRELCRKHLIESGRVAWDQEDRRGLADLYAVMRGVGVFGANQADRVPSRLAGMPLTSTEGPPVPSLADALAQLSLCDRVPLDPTERLSQSSFGYALARFAVFRDERRPAWFRHVRADVRALIKQSIRYLTNE